MSTKLQIRTVTYSRLVTTGEYENHRLEMTAIVPKGSDGRKEARQLKDKVSALLGQPNRRLHTYGHGPVCICDECM